MIKTVNNLTRILWVAYALLVVYMLWDDWPHSAGWFAALVWFGMYIIVYISDMGIIAVYRKLVKDMLGDMQDMARRVVEEAERNAKIEEALVDRITELEGVLKQHDRNTKGII